MSRTIDITRRALRRVLGARTGVSHLEPQGDARGRALISYLYEAVPWSADDPRLTGHTNRWESREIARLLAELGFAVDAINFGATSYEPSGAYDVIFAIDGELVRLRAATSATKALLHLTGSHPAFQNHAEQHRIDDLARRRGARCVPRRMVGGIDELDEALRMADACSLLGNESTLTTYPAEVRRRITCMSVTASVLREVRTPERLATAGDAFLWFFGSGAIHKGLDRVLDAFALRPDLRLHVVGNIGHETDFMRLYHDELFRRPNIRFHGLLDPSGEQFASVARDSGFLVAPTCSESMSTAVATMLVYGMYPVISRQSGITLPDGCGRFLTDCSVEDVESACDQVAALGRAARMEQVRAIQEDAAERYSRARFTAAMRRHLSKALT